MDAFFCIIFIEFSSISTMCKRKHLIWLFRASPPTSKIKCYPSFPPYSQTLSLWSLLIHKWVCFKPNHKEKNLISIFWSCFVFLARILPAMLCYSKSQDFSSSPNLSCKLWILNWNILPLKNILWNFTYFHLSVWIGLKSKMAQIFCTLPHFRLPQHQFSKSDLIGESASVFEVAFHYSVFIYNWPILD